MTQLIKKGLCLTLTLLLALSMTVPAFASGLDTGMPPADVIYNTDNWPGETLILDENKTVKISGITQDNTDSDNGPAIKICGNSVVNLVFEGENVLSGNADKISAGIEVEAGSTVNIYGLSGSSLTVTGGKYGAGIGGKGYSVPEVNNPEAGNVNIYSGTITAIGGLSGAGVGSGYHSSAGNIHIFGGDVTAIGTSGGAGIGGGYATSGGSATAARVGFYNGGNITISGGVVRASATRIDFDSFDVFNRDTYYGEGYSNTFAAGIGGGYGGSSGNIVIEGDADVTAFGSCGGAGIGTGRGTTSANKFDAERYDCSVIIRGSAKVAAAAGADHRESLIGDDGGAAIGLGRHGHLEGSPKGTVVIDGSAQVIAVAEDHANAIGAGVVTGKFSRPSDGEVVRPAYAYLETLSIGSGCTVIAANDGSRAVIEPADDLKNLTILNASDEFKYQYADVFFASEGSIGFRAYDRATDLSLSPDFDVVLQSTPAAESFGFILPAAPDRMYFTYGEYRLGNNAEERFTDFVTDANGVKAYDLTCLCYTATFVGYDTVIDVDYPVGTSEITEPAPPERPYYTAAWEEYELNGNVTVHAVYTPIEYTAVFVDENGETVAQIPYTVETESITPPAVPEKEYYTVRWENYTLAPDGVTVHAVYTPIEYTAVFVDENGGTVAEIPYTVETQSITPPAVPEKENYSGKWEDYTLVPDGITVHAVYTPTDTPSGDNVCKWDNVDHGTSFLGKLTKFFHSILYFFAHLFGKR